MPTKMAAESAAIFKVFGMLMHQLLKQVANTDGDVTVGRFKIRITVRHVVGQTLQESYVYIKTHRQFVTNFDTGAEVHAFYVSVVAAAEFNVCANVFNFHFTTDTETEVRSHAYIKAAVTFLAKLVQYVYRHLDVVQVKGRGNSSSEEVLFFFAAHHRKLDTGTYIKTAGNRDVYNTTNAGANFHIAVVRSSVHFRLDRSQVQTHFRTEAQLGRSSGDSGSRKGEDGDEFFHTVVCFRKCVLILGCKSR